MAPFLNISIESKNRQLHCVRLLKYRGIAEPRDLVVKSHGSLGPEESELRLEKMIARVYSNVFLYETCSYNELRRFARDRKLPKTAPDTKGGLIRILEDADENVSFKIFAELPAELRVKIYEWHFQEPQNFGLWGARLPAITLVSKLLRKETMPICEQVLEEHRERRARWAASWANMEMMNDTDGDLQ